MKKFLATILALTMILALAACGGNDSGSSSAPPADSGSQSSEPAPSSGGSGEAKTVGIAMPTQSLERWNRSKD